MTKKLDHEIKAMRAINRALDTLDDRARVRVLDYFHAREHGKSQATVRRALRLVGLEPKEATG